MIYNIKPGETLLGSNETSCEIILTDEDIHDIHCRFCNNEGNVTLSPIGNAECFVNNVQVKINHKISQGISYNILVVVCKLFLKNIYILLR